MALSYQRPGFTLSTGSSGQEVRDLQTHLRSLGYLRRGIDGGFGDGTRRAVQALQYDLLHNDGSGSDGSAPVSVKSYNRGRVSAVTGTLDQGLAACIADLLADPAFPKLPAVPDPKTENQKIAVQIAQLPPTDTPTAFLVAVLKQESGLMQYAVPGSESDSDTFVVVGTDTNAGADYVITSRGYGAGQYTLFHHPPRPDEVTGVIEDPSRNVARASKLLREKLDSFVAGPTARADDRTAEIGPGPVRVCKYARGDARYLADCKNCLAAAGTRDIKPGLPVYTGSTTAWEPTQYYPTATYSKVPRREEFGCDWPYAVRRYNGGGINSYHYQARVLLHLAALL